MIFFKRHSLEQKCFDILNSETPLLNELIDRVYGKQSACNRRNIIKLLTRVALKLDVDYFLHDNRVYLNHEMQVAITKKPTPDAWINNASPPDFSKPEITVKKKVGI